MHSEIEISVVKSADAAQILALYKAENWWEQDDDPSHLEGVAAIIRSTYRFVIASKGDEIVGMGRAISDGVSDAYIQDVAVRKDYRGQGIGKEIIRALLKELKSNGLQWIGLICEPGYERFYQSLGFEIMQSYTPFLYKGE